MKTINVDGNHECHTLNTEQTISADEVTKYIHGCQRLAILLAQHISHKFTVAEDTSSMMTLLHRFQGATICRCTDPAKEARG